MTRSELVDQARKYVGIPWLHQGRSVAGVDCIGVLLGVSDAFDVYYEDMQGYARTPEGHVFLRQLLKFFPISRSAPQAGSIGVFRQGSFPCHVGIFGEDNKKHLTLINASIKHRKVVEERFVPESWNLVYTLNFPGVTD